MALRIRRSIASIFCCGLIASHGRTAPLASAAATSVASVTSLRRMTVSAGTSIRLVERSAAADHVVDRERCEVVE